MTVPSLLLFFAFHTVPALQGIYYSFTNWNGLAPTFKFIGLRNYQLLFQDIKILNVYLFTIKFAVTTTILVNILSLTLALGLNTKIHFQKFFRAVYFLPNILSVLIVGFIFNFIYSNVLTKFGQSIGSELLSRNILGDKNLAWLGIVVVAVWQSSAFNTILYLSGLQTVPKELYESASIDGASGWRRFWSITFPMIAPFFTINMVLALKGFLMVFDHIIALTGGGPGRATESISIVIFRGGLSGNQFAYQSANAVIYFIFIFVVSILQIKILQKREDK